MTFGRALPFLTYAVVFWSFAMLLLFAQLQLVSIVAFLLFFFLSITKDRISFTLPTSGWALLNISALFLALYAWFVLNIYFDTVVNFFLYLVIIRLWTRKSNREVLQLYGLTFFNVLAASVSTASIFFAPALIVYLFLILAAMIAITIRGDAELAYKERRKQPIPVASDLPRQPLRMAGQDRRRLKLLDQSLYLNRWAMGAIAIAMVFILVVGLGLFFVIPRLQGQVVQFGLTPNAAASMSSGFSDTISFTNMGEIQNNPAIALRVMPGRDFPLIDGYPEHSLMRIRGTSMDFFDGRRWTKSEAVLRRFDTIERRRQVELPTEPIVLQPEETYRVRIQAEPNSRGYLFGPERPTQFFFETDTTIVRDPTSLSIQLINPNWSQPIQYVVETRTPKRDWRVLAGNILPLPPGETLAPKAVARSRRPEGENPLGRWGRRVVDEDVFGRIYLQQPEISDMEVIRRVAREWVGENALPVDIPSVIERRFRTQFSYSLENDFSDRPDHLAYFLSVGRQGHCEYFATAMALMLRTLGIPSRVVNGFATDEWVGAGSGGYFLARQEHAHSWVEAWYPNVGWVTFDPTPVSGIGGNRIAMNFYRKLLRWHEQLKFLWYNTVIDYGIQDQGFVYRSLFTALAGTRHLAFGLNEGVQGLLSGGSKRSLAMGLGMLLVSAALFAVGIFLAWKAYKKKKLATRTADLSGDAFRSPFVEYQSLLDALELEIPRKSSHTPMEFARYVTSERHSLRDFLPLTEIYYHARYNGTNWSPKEADRANALLRQIAAAKETTLSIDDSSEFSRPTLS